MAGVLPAGTDPRRPLCPRPHFLRVSFCILIMCSDWNAFLGVWIDHLRAETRVRATLLHLDRSQRSDASFFLLRCTPALTRQRGIAISDGPADSWKAHGPLRHDFCHRISHRQTGVTALGLQGFLGCFTGWFMRVDCDLGVPERSTAGLQQRRDRDPSIPRSSRWAVDLLDGAQEKCQLSARATGNLCCGRAVGAGGIPFLLLFFFFSLLLTILDSPLYSWSFLCA
ncbi:hypothetical protein BO86DRAFT_238240 [Aspergillus japonicus CBS 114.51]|uniref:Uncharacterized protein n=1 Tax=Aspergillus japonicus CBS 114.51 TaxID=1448312 RepID=A0A8T8WM62_ASPJA|nr:hypothetical protein BO86DRAFT_238240 [Aspergillus japonicus CBS 114.51]RAH76794.1 hypothetical protein BO86DRAFT_238240 [Aspergillus japonicus CBS 114.51]